MAKSKLLPAPFWKRVVAYIIDLFVISFIVINPFQYRINAITSEPANFAEAISSLQTVFTRELVALSVIIAVLTLVYWTYLEYYFGQTVGKILLRINVTGTTKERPKLIQIIVRNVTKLSSLLIILDTLYLLFTRRGQRYFEKISNTTVIQEIRK